MTRPLATPEEVLESGLANHFERPVRVVEMDAGSPDLFSTHPIRRLRATLDDGAGIPIIFKRLEPKPEKDIRRELLTYRNVLSGKRFGAPDLYASLCDEERGVYWLFLEDVGEWKLEWCEADTYLAAFRWLARMHAEMRGENLRSLDFLGEHGPDFYRDLARKARRSLRQSGEKRTLDRFDRLMERFFDSSVIHLSRQPRTFLHGDVYASNLIVGSGEVIRPVDWEWAATGPAAWDVAKLLAGWGKEKPRMLAAYRKEFESRSGVKVDERGFDRALSHARIMHALWNLRWRTSEGSEVASGILGGMEEIWEGLDG